MTPNPSFIRSWPTKHVLSDAEVVSLHQRRRTTEEDTLGLRLRLRKGAACSRF